MARLAVAEGGGPATASAAGRHLAPAVLRRHDLGLFAASCLAVAYQCWHGPPVHLCDLSMCQRSSLCDITACRAGPSGRGAGAAGSRAVVPASQGGRGGRGAGGRGGGKYCVCCTSGAKLHLCRHCFFSDCKTASAE